MVEKLKVIHVGIHFNPLRGGGNLRNSRLIGEYVQNYEETVSIYSYPYHGFDYVNDHERINLIYLKSALEQVWKARMDAGDRHRQVIHAHNPRVFFFAALLFWRSRIVLELHSAQELSPFKRFLLRISVHRAFKIIVLADSGVKTVCDTLGVDETKVAVVPNGKEVVQIVSTAESTKEGVVFGYIGTFYIWQGVHEFAKAAIAYLEQYPDDRTTTFLMVGGGPELESVGRTVEESKFKDRIVLKGQVTPDQVADYWELIDVIVMPRPSTQATESTTPLKLVEALFYGKVIIGSEVGGLTEQLKHNQNSLLHPPGDTNALVTLMRDLVVSEGLRSRLSRAALECGKALASWCDSAQKLRDIYMDATSLDSVKR